MYDPQAPEIAALAPCPFCGGNVRFATGFIFGLVRCAVCQIGTAEYPIERKAEAIAAWNRRPLPIAPQETMREIAANIANSNPLTCVVCTSALPNPECGHRLNGVHPCCYPATDNIEDAIFDGLNKAYALGQSHSPATVERELVEALRKCRIFIQRAVDIKNTFAVGEALLAAIDKALATASQPVDDDSVSFERHMSMFHRATAFGKALVRISAIFGKWNERGDRRISDALAHAILDARELITSESSEDLLTEAEEDEAFASQPVDGEGRK